MLQRFESFVTGITLCHKYIQKIKSAEMTDFGLKGTHVMCLFYLHNYPDGLTAAQLSRLCAEDKAAISRTLAVLLDKGYILPGETKYNNILQLTDKGIAIAEQIDGLIAQWVSLGGDGLSEEERTVFYRTLEKISLNLIQSHNKTHKSTQIERE